MDFGVKMEVKKHEQTQKKEVENRAGKGSEKGGRKGRVAAAGESLVEILIFERRAPGTARGRPPREGAAGI